VDESKKSARLEEWFVGPDDLLFGKVYGHATIPDGEVVQTSRVVSFNPEKNEAITKNTHYILGKPMDSYEQD